LLGEGIAAHEGEGWGSLVKAASYAPARVLAAFVHGLLQLPGDDFAELWHTLVSRRAVARSELPGELANHAEAVLRLLLQLDYMEPMRIEQEDAVRFPHALRTGILSRTLANHEILEGAARDPCRHVDLASRAHLVAAVRVPLR
jgi:hypothetical protein